MSRTAGAFNHKPLLEWARDNRVLRLKVSGLEVEFLQGGQTGMEAPPNETPEEYKKRMDRVMFHSTDG